MFWWVEHSESCMAGFMKSRYWSETRAHANVIEELDDFTYSISVTSSCRSRGASTILALAEERYQREDMTSLVLERHYFYLDLKRQSFLLDHLPISI